MIELGQYILSKLPKSDYYMVGENAFNHRLTIHLTCRGRELIKKFRAKEKEHKVDTWFKPFYNISYGVWIRSADDLRKFEKAHPHVEGITTRELRQAWAKEAEHKDVLEARHLENRVKDVMKDVNGGRKFSEELRAQSEYNKSLHGIRTSK